MANGSYSAGNLEFVTQQISEKTLSSLDTLIARLQTTMNLLGSVSTLSKNIGTTVGKASSSSVSSNKGDSLSKQTESAKLTKTIKNDVAQINASVKKMSTKSLTDIVNKVYFWHNYTKQMFRSLTGIVQLAVDYAETLNLWQVAMRGYREEAEDFVASMNKAYGIATKTLMQYQAVFRNMLSSLGGINENVSYQLSEYLTQMALDYASLYNTSIERAMTTFQSVLSGQVRPIRSIAGYDITETTIYQLYQQLGGTKTMRQLTQTEKRLLRIYAVFNQMESSGAVNDLAKTMGSTANQMRIFTESTKELGTWLGITLEMYIKPILPYLNAFVITLTNIAKAMAKMKGYTPVEYGAVESVQELNEALDQTQGKLLSFDRFEALNSGEDDNNLLGIDENLLAGLSQYSSSLSEVTGKAQDLAKKWTSWWVDADTGELTKQAQRLLDVLNGIAITLGIIVAFRITSKIFGLLGSLTGITKVLGGLKLGLFEVATTTKGLTTNVTMLGKAFSFILNHPIIFAIGAVIALLVYLYNTNEDFRRSVNNLFKELKNLTGAFKLVGDSIDLVVDSVVSLIKIIKPSLDMIGHSIGFIIDLLLGDFKGAWEHIKGYFTSFGQFFVNLWKAIANSFAGIVNWIANMFISLVNLWIDQINIMLKPVDWIAGLFGKNVQIPKWEAEVNWMPYKSFKTGGLVEDGLFQMSRGEIIGEFDDGTTRVANNQQITKGIEDASYRGIARAMREYGGQGGGDVYIDGTKAGQVVAKSVLRENIRTGRQRVGSATVGGLASMFN